MSFELQLHQAWRGGAHARQIPLEKSYGGTAVRPLFLLDPSLTLSAQQRNPPVIPWAPLGAGPFIFDTAEQHKIRVFVVTKGLSHPSGLAFLPDGSMFMTERAGRLRLVRDEVLDPKPVPGVPEVHAKQLSGLMDIALHPRFSENRFVYLTYTKALEKGVTTALARGRWENGTLQQVREIFVADSADDGRAAASRLAFGPDSSLYMTVGGTFDQRAQDPNSHGGKVLRLRDDGSAPPDNPFAGKPGYKAEIFTFGHRNALGLAVHPQTGLVWENENGPNGGDEINILLPGRNCGWPLVSYGRQYPGPRVSELWKEGLEEFLVVWLPSIGISGMAFIQETVFPTGEATYLSARCGSAS